MLDYAHWLKRAEDFVRGLGNLPGQWGVSIAIEPPLARRAADELRNRLPFGLPAPLYDLYTQGSASYRCAYYWSPDEAHLPLVGEVFPHTYSLYGGARFIPACQLADAHASVRSWARGWNGTPDGGPRPSWEAWQESIPFLAVGNGDYLALRVRGDRTDLPVIYLCHDAEDGGDGRTAFEISPSFDQFLSDWETLCYIGPEIWLLAAFLSDDGEGPVQVNQPKVALWREIVCGRRTVTN